MLSDTTSVTSPTPFSPFSSAFSVSSEATVVSESGEADLGAFQSVFIALSQLQQHHSQQDTSHQQGRQSAVISDNDNSYPTRTNTPSVHPMSPLNLDPYTSSHPPSRIANRSTSSYDTESRGARTERTVDGESDVVLTATGVSPSSAAEDGDEESVALTSPNSRPSSDGSSVPDEDAVDKEIEDPRMWTFTEISPYPQSFRAADGTPDSDRYPLREDSVTEDGEGPSLGDLGSAFAFFAAERAKLTRQLELSKTGTPIASDRDPSRKKNGKGAGKGQAKTAGKSTLSATATPADVMHDSDESEEAARALAAGSSLQVAPLGLSSSSMDDTFEARVKQHRGVLQRLPKTLLRGQKPSTSSTPPVSFPNNNNNRRRPGNHRHSRSLPTDANAIGSLNPSPARAPSSDISRIQSLARRLTFQFPSDAPLLRRVIADPQLALGIGAHVTPTDDALVAQGFFDPVRDADGSDVASGSSSSENALLYVFIDHSNILVGFLEWLKRQKEQGLHVGTRSPKPKLSHSALVLLLERGRRCLRRVLVASSPLYQSLDEIAGMGYQISVLQRVEIKEGAFASGRHQRTGSSGNIPHSASNSTLGSASATGTPSRQSRKNGRGRAKGRGQHASETSVPSNNGAHSGSSTESEQPTPVSTQPQTNRRAAKRAAFHHRRTSSDQAFLTPSNSSTSLVQAVADPSPAGSTGSASRPRFREEAVDELLQLKLLQTLLDTPSPPPSGSTIVLASGDAARSQFNPEGFLGCVRKALERGWNVEVVGWDEGRSRAYVELVNEVERGTLGGKMSVVGIDRWGLDLAEY